MADLKTLVVEELGESWVNIASRSATPLPTLGEEYLRLLKEAQRESNHSSLRQSVASSRINSPKSPPNSPSTEPSTEDELKGIFVNYCGSKVREAQTEYNSTLLSLPMFSRYTTSPPSPPLSPNSGYYYMARNKSDYQWINRQDQRIQTRLEQPSIQKASLLDKEILVPFLVSNTFLFALGIGFGIWLRLQ